MLPGYLGVQVGITTAHHLSILPSMVSGSWVAGDMQSDV